MKLKEPSTMISPMCVLLLLAGSGWTAHAAVFLQGPMAGKEMPMAWGAKQLTKFTGYTEQQIRALSSFSEQPEILLPDAYTTIWDYFPIDNVSQYPLTNSPVLQDPLLQSPTELVATACDTCQGAQNQQLVDLPANSTSWTFIWEQVMKAYQSLLEDPTIPQGDNATNFKMAMSWYTYPGSLNGTIASPRIHLGLSTGVCSTLYLEGLTGMDADEEQDITGLLPKHFQDLSQECGCDPLNSGPGSKGSPFRGGWKVMMRGVAEAWRFRIEQGGPGCGIANPSDASIQVL